MRHASTATAPRLRPNPALEPAVLDRLVFERGFPLAEPGVTTFAYRGNVDSVRLIHFGIGLPENLAFERLEGSDWWLLALGLPTGTRLEYKLAICHNDHEWDTEDPLNPFESRNPFGSNSVCRSYGYSVPPWALRDPDAQTGLQRSMGIWSKALGRAMPVTLYLPASFTMNPDYPYPLLVMHDGTDYLHYADAATVLDNLISQGLIPEMVVAFSDPGQRLAEYANDHRHAQFVAEEMVPYLEAHLPLTGGRGARCLGGASFGAVATLSTAVRYPDTFGHLLLQSGSFAGAQERPGEAEDSLWQPVVEFVSNYLQAPSRVADRVFMSCGVLEPLIRENRALIPVLQKTGMEVVLEEAIDGHTWGCWRDMLGMGLPWLFTDSFQNGEGQKVGGAPPSAKFLTNEKGERHG